MDKTQILIVEDHPLIRKGIITTIEEEPDLEVCWEADNVPDGLKIIQEYSPDFVIVDISLEQSNGIDLIRMLQESQQDVPVLVISMHDEAVYIKRAFKAGARGYLLKRESVDQVTVAIRKILRGQIYTSETVSMKVFENFSVNQTVSNKTNLKTILSEREYEIFELLGEGLDRLQISEFLNISPKTVGSHIDRMKDKLKIKTSRKLIQSAIQHGIKTE